MDRLVYSGPWLRHSFLRQMDATKKRNPWSHKWNETSILLYWYVTRVFDSSYFFTHFFDGCPFHSTKAQQLLKSLTRCTICTTWTNFSQSTVKAKVASAQIHPVFLHMHMVVNPSAFHSFPVCISHVQPTVHVYCIQFLWRPCSKTCQCLGSNHHLYRFFSSLFPISEFLVPFCLRAN